MVSAAVGVTSPATENDQPRNPHGAYNTLACVCRKWHQSVFELWICLDWAVSVVSGESGWWFVVLSGRSLY